MPKLVIVQLCSKDRRELRLQLNATIPFARCRYSEQLSGVSTTNMHAVYCARFDLGDLFSDYENASNLAIAPPQRIREEQIVIFQAAPMKRSQLTFGFLAAGFQSRRTGLRKLPDDPGTSA
jgi:hypothetical protein